MDSNNVKKAILQSRSRCRVGGIDIINLPKLNKIRDLNKVSIEIAKIKPIGNIINCKKYLVL